MSFEKRSCLALLACVLSIATVPAVSAEPTEEMRTMARMFVALEARNQPGYCEAMHGAAYVGYLDKVCQMAVQNRLKQPADCVAERIAQEMKDDKQKCLAMPAAEFEKVVARGQEGRQSFIRKMAAQGIDGEKLMQDARAKKR